MFSRIFEKSLKLPSVDEALPNRAEPMVVAAQHLVLETPMEAPFPDGLKTIYFGMGCFWGAERLFWQLPGVYSTAVGYGGGYTANPSYEDVCSGQTAHTELVMVVYDPEQITLETLLKNFWQSHDPTQGMRQSNDRGTQYRSFIGYCQSSQAGTIAASRQHYQSKLTASGFGDITTEITELKAFYYAEDYHQQYLHKNPGGYCGLAGTGVCFGKASDCA